MNQGILIAFCLALAAHGACWAQDKPGPNASEQQTARDALREMREMDSRKDQPPAEAPKPPERAAKPAPAQTLLAEEPATPQTRPAPRSAPARLSVPNETDRTEAARAYQTIQSAAFLKSLSSAERTAIVQKLLQSGADPAKDPAERYVVLEAVMEIAAKTGDAELLLQTAQTLGDFFTVDPLPVKVARLQETFKAVQDRRAFIQDIEPLIGEAVRADRYDLAVEVLDLALQASRLARDEQSARRLSVRGKDLREIQAQQAKVKGDIDALTRNPNDRDACFAVGNFLCLTKGDWDQGLPLLARGSEEVLKALAQRDLDNPTRTDKQLDLAEAWWSLASRQTALARRNVQLRAAKWYQAALPSLVGPEQTRVERRLAGIPLPPVSVVGRWEVTTTPGKGKSTSVVWAFHKDGKVVAEPGKQTGKWRKDHNVIRITWDAKPTQWQALRLPLRIKDTVGVGSTGEALAMTRLSEDPTAPPVAAAKKK
ncbi:MAG TPA: hypothetical protein PKG77_03995 [Phycisphaerae bacterium]|nr:hypothetical protein [Phycisphaerae bacterium]HQL72396.1 hypothetical protein [Phycisphaerae bacterium]